MLPESYNVAIETTTNDTAERCSARIHRGVSQTGAPCLKREWVLVPGYRLQPSFDGDQLQRTDC